MKKLLFLLIIFFISKLCFGLGGPGFDSYRDWETYAAVTTTFSYLSEAKVSTATPDGMIRFHAEISSYVFTSTCGAKMYIQTTKDFLHPTFPVRLFEMPIIKWDPPAILSDRFPFFIGPQYFVDTYEQTFYISIIDTAGNYADMIYFSTKQWGCSYGDTDGTTPEGFDWFSPNWWWKDFKDGGTINWSSDYLLYNYTGGYGIYFDGDEFYIDMSTGNYGISGYRNEEQNYTIFHIGDGSAAQTEDLEFQIFATSVTVAYQGIPVYGIDSSGQVRFLQNITYGTTFYGDTGNFGELTSHSPLQMNTSVQFNRETDFDGQVMRGAIIVSSGTYGEIYLHRGGSVTTIGAQGTYLKVMATTTLGTSSFFSMPDDNCLQYDGIETKQFMVTVNFSAYIAAGVKDNIAFAIYKNGGLIPSSEITRYVAASSDIGAMPIQCHVELATGDQVELWGANLSATNGIVIHSLNFMAMSAD